MSTLPLSERSIIANAIADFVLAHPDITDIFEAYNQWAVKEQTRDFPWDKGWMPAFCLEIFNTCIHKMERGALEEVVQAENSAIKRAREFAC